jgi:hypothetical protein
MKKPVPIPGVIKCEVWVDKIEGERIFVKGELSDGHGRVLDTVAACRYPQPSTSAHAPAD